MQQIKSDRFVQAQSLPAINTNGINKRKLVDTLYRQIYPLTQGFFHDESWEGINRIWRALDELGVDWNVTDSYYGEGRYDHTLPSERKTWKFEIRFTNERGKPDTIYGTVVAAGGGSIEEPLEKYDITVVMSQSQKNIKEAVWRDKMPGGKADRKEPGDFDKTQLGKGKKIELEHTDDPQIATEITMDHLEESKDTKRGKGGKYYDLLEEMEKNIKRKIHDKD